MRSRVPEVTLLECDLDVSRVSELALREGNSKKPIYELHKWWARRLGSVFRWLLLAAVTPAEQGEDELWRQFYSPRDLGGLEVLDPFMGGGTTIVEALKLGARATGVDIDPVACFVVASEIADCDEADVRHHLACLEQSVWKGLRPYFVTMGESGEMVPVIYFFWVRTSRCRKCGASFECHPHCKLAVDSKRNRQWVFCSACHSVAEIPMGLGHTVCEVCGTRTSVNEGTVFRGIAACPHCGEHEAVVEQVRRTGSHLDAALFALEYEDVDGTRKFKAADGYDFERYHMAERQFALEVQPLVPEDDIPSEGRTDPRPISHGFRKYRDLFNPRQLLALARIASYVRNLADGPVKRFLVTCFSDALASNNMLCSYAFGYRKLTPLFGIHSYNVVSRPVENNVWGDSKYGRGTFRRCVQKGLQGKAYAHRPYELSYQDGKARRVFMDRPIGDSFRLLRGDSTNLSQIGDATVDLVVTDPPYFDNLSYHELSDFFYVWLRLLLHQTPELSRHPLRCDSPTSGKERRTDSFDTYRSLLAKVLGECQRVLRPGGIVAFTFHHRTDTAWKALAQALVEARLKVTNILPVRSEGKSGFHSHAGTIKWDTIVITRAREHDQNQDGYQASSRLRRLLELMARTGIPYSAADQDSCMHAAAMEFVVNTQGMTTGEVDNSFDCVLSELRAGVTE
jgi:putative DNA methylase